MYTTILILLIILTLLNVPFGVMTYVGLYNKYKNLMNRGNKHK